MILRRLAGSASAATLGFALAIPALAPAQARQVVIEPKNAIQGDVSGVVQADGHPTDCNLLENTGGPDYAKAALRWLKTGARDEPPMMDGEPVAKRCRIVISFSRTK